jgi:hypothetical protein
VLGIAEIYIPYRLYRLTLRDRRLQIIRYYAVDSATGTLDPYEFAFPPDPDACIELETENVHPVRLDEGLTKKMVAEKVRRFLYSRGFFRLTNPSITAELIKPEFYIPYWAAFCGGQQNVRTIVIDAVRQTVEGSKARQLVETWLLDGDGDAGLRLTGADLV